MSKFDKLKPLEKIQFIVFIIILMAGMGSISYFCYWLSNALFGSFISYLIEAFVTFGLIIVVINVSKMDLS